MPETPGYVVLKNKDTGASYAAVVPDGVDEQDVIDAWKANASGWSRGAKTELPDLLEKQSTNPVEPATPKEKQS